VTPHLERVEPVKTRIEASGGSGVSTRATSIMSEAAAFGPVYPDTF
jgi:hypothetical protein